MVWSPISLIRHECNRCGYFSFVRILVIGGSGLLGNEVCSAIERAGHVSVAPSHAELDITNPESVAQLLLQKFGSLDAVVNCAAYTAVDRAESEPDAATDLNALGPGYLATVSAACGLPLIHVSTDFVFSGTSERPYREDDPTEPLGVYGRSKLGGEEAILESGAMAWIVRTSWLYGPCGNCFPAAILRAWQAGKELRVVADQVGCPTSAFALAETLVRILKARPPFGVYHASGPDAMSWYEFACLLLEIARSHTGRDVPPLEPISSADWPTAAQRPAYSVLDCGKLREAGIPPMPSCRASLEEFVRIVLP